MSDKIGTPTKKGLKDSAVNYGVGLGAGLLYKIVTSLTGSGLLGGLAGAVVTGSIVKGERSDTITTILGFQSIAGGNPTTATATSASADSDIM